MRIATLWGALVGLLWGFEAPVSVQALLKEVHSAARYTLYAPAYGYLGCALYGVAEPFYTTPEMACQADPKRVREMRYHAKNFARRYLYLEQQYRLGYTQGACLLQKGARLWNAILIEEGYAVFVPQDKSEASAILREELERLEAIAKRDQKGLWKEWAKEMECLSSLLKNP